MRWWAHVLSELVELPVNVPTLTDGMIDLEKSVGPAAHRAVTQQGADDDLALHFRQTSHGVAHCTHRVRQFRGSPL